MRTPLTAIPVVAGFAASAALLALAACGGGGGSATTSGGGEGPATTLAELILPPQRAGWAGLPPVIQFGDELRIGATPPPARSALAPVAAHGQATVSHGTVQDGVGAATLIDYLQRDAAAAQAGVPARFGEAPTVRYVEGTSAGQVDELVGAVRLINASLPRDFQLTVDPSPVTAAADAAGTGAATLAAGQILVEYDRREDWEITYDAGANPVGAALQVVDEGGAISAARVYVDDTRVPAGAPRMEVLVHELIHALGRFHPDPVRFPDSIMNIPAVAADAYLLYPLDREALLAVYGTLSPGAAPGEIATDLGPWDDESMHVRGDLGDLAFGASLRNGLAQPWAALPRPGIDLADNDALTGSATWTGRLLGLTPTADSVAAAAGLTIDLASLRGTLDFTEMESWAGAPGLAGSGATWRTGDLNYTISVRGNLFGRTGGDEGRITGAFSGASHEGMGGTLTRDDLAAGFAGRR